MTREEAIKILEQRAGHSYPKFIDAVNVAYHALRAQQEPVKLDRDQWERCEWCKGCGAVICEEHNAMRPKKKRSVIAVYCPNCGHPLTEEAWAELERRIGGAYETD